MKIPSQEVSGALLALLAETITITERGYCDNTIAGNSAAQQTEPIVARRRLDMQTVRCQRNPSAPAEEPMTLVRRTERNE